MTRNEPDLRGTALGVAEHRRIERMVLPPGRRRRFRQVVDIEFCADGWHSDSGSPDRPSDPAICQCIFEAHGDVAEYHRFHADHPVVWRVTKTTPHHYRLRETWCDAFLPDEWRDLWTT